MMRRELVPLLHGTAAALMLGAGLLTLLPVRTRVAAVAPNLPAPATPAAAAAAVPATAPVAPAHGVGRDDAEHIVNTNLFSATRRAPRVAFVAPGMDDTSLLPSGDGAAPDANGAAMPSAVVPVLEGIVIRDGRAHALVRLMNAGEEAAAAPRLLAIGERIGAYRVRSIGRDHVVLTSTGGTQTLRLQRQLPSDSSAPRP